MSDARDAVAEHLDAFNAHDTTRLLRGLATDVVWTTGTDTATGHDALADLFDDWLWSLEPRLDTVRLVVDGEQVAAELRESLTLEGERRDYSIAVFFTVTDGLITRAKVYREGNADVDQ